MQFCLSLKKFTRAYLFQIAREKSCDYLDTQVTRCIFTWSNVIFSQPVDKQMQSWEREELITFSVGRFLTKQLLNALRIPKFYVFKKAVGTVVSKGILFSS